MSENTTHTPETPEPVDTPAAPEMPEVQAEVAAQPTVIEIDPNEVEKGKVLAILSYIFILWLIPIIQKDNEYSLFHAKQALMIFLASIALGLLNVIPCIGQLAYVIGSVGLFVFWVIGLINAIKGQAKLLPVIGKFAEQWFSGLKKNG